jgi:Ca-activated chloride channel family protein
MGGEKIERARDSVVELIRELDADDEIAVVQYDNESQVVQRLARVDVREALIAKVRAITAGGGTNIPPALAMGLRELEEVGRGRVRRIVLASDGRSRRRATAVSSPPP